MNLSADDVSERFSRGLTEDLTSLLAREPQLRVASRTRMTRYGHGQAEAGRIGREPGVGAVLEGSVRREGDHFVVTARLIDTRNGYHLWADRFERRAAEAADRQSALASAIMARLRNVVSGQIAEPLHLADADTMERYHRAQELLRIPVLKDGPPKETPGSVTEAIRLFREVTVRSPRFAKGWSGLAEAAEWAYEIKGNQPKKGWWKQDQRPNGPWRSIRI